MSTRIALVVAILALAALAALAVLSGTASLPAAPSASALPPAGTDRLNVTAEVTIISRIGEETIALSGTVDIQRDDPRMEGDVEVVDAEIVALDLEGEGITGPVMVSQSETHSSTGEIRSLQPPPDQFPASSFLDVYIVAQIPSSAEPSSPPVHNEEPLRLIAAPDLAAWPPAGATYSWETTTGVDDDGDTLIDEDTADDDGDGTVDEDPINDPPYNNDTDDQFDEDPPLSQCTLELCDNDGDTLIDEDPSCTPLLSPAGSHLKTGFCVTSLSVLVAPTITPIPTATPTSTATPTMATITLTPTGAPTTPTPTPTSTPTTTSTDTASPTNTPALPTAARTASPTNTSTPSPTPTPTASPLLVGDATCDGFVNSIDAAVILQYDAGLLDSLDCPQRADANEDGRINAIDAQLILQYDAGLIPGLPP